MAASVTARTIKEEAPSMMQRINQKSHQMVANSRNFKIAVQDSSCVVTKKDNRSALVKKMADSSIGQEESSF